MLLGVTIVMVAAAAVSQRSSNEPASVYGLHAPGLASRADEVGTIVIRTAGTSLRLARADGSWVARSRDDYPADVERIRRLVLGISGLERLEEKTSNPDRLHRLGLRDIDEPGSRAVRVTLLSGAGDALADVLVGKTQDFQRSGRSRYFVRDAGDPQSWLVEGSLPPVLDEVSHWLEQALLPGVAEAGLQSVTVTHADGGSVTIRRDGNAETDFALDGLSDGEEIDSRYAVNAIADTFERLTLKDVRAAPENSPDETIATVEALTFNGVRIVAGVGPADPDYTVRLHADADPGRDRAGADSGPDTSGAHLVRALNDRWRSRSFVVSQYALDSLLVRRADLIDGPGGSGAE